MTQPSSSASPSSSSASSTPRPTTAHPAQQSQRATPLRVVATEFHDIDGDLAGTVPMPRSSLPRFSEKQHIGVLRVFFSISLDNDLVKASPFHVDENRPWSGFVVQQDGAAAAVPGMIRVDSGNTAVLEFTVEGRQWLKSGKYTVTLSSVDDANTLLPALTDHNHVGFEGDSFKFRFTITND